MKKFEITLKDLAKYNNTGERKIVVDAIDEGTAIELATQKFKKYDLVGFKELEVEPVDLEGVVV